MAYQNQKVKTRQVVTPNTQTQDLGIVSNVPMGDWNATTQYQKLNMVRYNGATYIAKKQSQGVEPTVATGWKQVWQLVVGDGRGITSTVIDYQASNSNTIPPTGDWVRNIPDVPQGQYLWTRTTINYTDGTQTVGYTISLQVLGFTQQDRDNIERITDAIPSSATADNPLATHEFVNSSINNMAAFYIEYNAQGDAWPTRASLLNATTFYNAGQVRVPTTNDYATVLADESQPKGADGTYPTTRYSYQGGTYPNGQWGFQYVVNNTSLTQAQVNAINSGITQSLVGQIQTNTNDISQKVNKSGDTMTGALNAPSVQVNGKEVYSPSNPPPTSEVVPNGTYKEMTVGNAINATNDGNGLNIANTYVKKSGGTMTGNLSIQSQYSGSGDNGVGVMYYANPSPYMIHERLYYDAGTPDNTRFIWSLNENSKWKKDPMIYYPKSDTFVINANELKVNHLYTRTYILDDESGNAYTGTDTVLEYYRSKDGYTWYRIWASGWKEMGGHIGNINNPSITEITFPVKFKTTQYVVTINIAGVGTSFDATGGIAVYTYYKQSNKCSVRMGYGTSNASNTVTRPFDWYACGF